MAICRRWENEEYAVRDHGEPVEGLAVANKRALVAGLVSVVIVILGLVGYWQYDLRISGPELFVDLPVSEQPASFSRIQRSQATSLGEAFARCLGAVEYAGRQDSAESF